MVSETCLWEASPSGASASHRLAALEGAVPYRLSSAGLECLAAAVIKAGLVDLSSLWAKLKQGCPGFYHRSASAYFLDADLS